MTDNPLRVAIIGSGFAGLGAAIRLQQSGVRDIVILERGDSIGGTWRDNTYPGAACDIPSHLYSLSFEPKHDWSRRYAAQAEIRAYLESCVDRNGLRPALRLNRSVAHARYDEATATWDIATQTGETFTADVLISAIGALRDPEYPDIPGRESFEGAQMHTARWDHSVDFTGKRVAVIGTGASSIQVAPELAKVAGRLTVFQRTPAWVTPRRDRAYTALEKALFRFVPAARRLHRGYIYSRLEGRFVFFGRSVGLNAFAAKRLTAYLRHKVDDRATARALTPRYRVGCKRILISDDYFPMFNRSNVTLNTQRIERIAPQGIVMDDGTTVDVDVIVWATGFAVRNPLGGLEITGVDGERLSRRWADRPSAHLGLTIPSFPNLFLLLGPNTGLGHNSIIFMIETQIAYILDALAVLRRRRGSYLNVREEVLEQFVEHVDSRHGDYVWASGCRSWYIDDQGRNFTLWPGSTVEYRMKARGFDPADFHLGVASGAGAEKVPA